MTMQEGQEVIVMLVEDIKKIRRRGKVLKVEELRLGEDGPLLARRYPTAIRLEDGRVVEGCECVWDEIKEERTV